MGCSCAVYTGYRGIYLGVFSPTEGAGVGAAGAFFFALGKRRLHWKEFMEAITETVRTTGMIMFIWLAP